MKTWVKLYTEINHDPDMAPLTWAQRGIWQAMLALAGEIDARDVDDHETGELDTPANVAWRIRCTLAEMQDAAKALAEQGMVEERDGILYLPHYGERQRRAPSSARERVAERVQRHRNNGAAACNEDVTRVQRGVTRTESESDTEAESDCAPAAAAPKAEPEVAAVMDRWEGVIGRKASPEDCRKLSGWLDDFGAERVSYAIGQCHLYGAPKLAYVWRVLSDGGAPRASPDPPPRASGPVVILNPVTGKREVIGGNGNTAGRETTPPG